MQVSFFVLLKKIARAMCGFFVIAVSIVFSLKANLGLSAFEVFHSGISRISGWDIGFCSIVVGVFILAVDILLKERIGIGTFLNIFFIGFFTDIVNNANIIPNASNIFFALIMLLVSLLLISYGVYLYISAGIGAGPRDSLTVALMRLTGQKIQVVRFGIEAVFFIAGLLLGGKWGIGTAVLTIFLGFAMGKVFALLNFDVKAVKHITFADLYRSFVKK